MRSIILVVIGLALGGFIRPHHISLAQAPVPAGTVITIAGIGPPGGFSGDGGPATGAFFQFPEGVAIDASGRLSIADVFNNRIRPTFAR